MNMGWEEKPIKGFLVDVDTGDKLEFQYNPDDIIDEKSTAFAPIKVPGMSHPRYQFVAGEPRKIGFRLSFFKEDVKSSVDWIRSLLYPEHAGTMLKNAPHKVLFMFGDLYPGTTCIVRQVKARYYHMFDRGNLLPLRADCEITLEEYVDESVNYSEVR